MHHLEPKLKRHTKIACNKPCRQNSVAPPGVNQKNQKTKKKEKRKRKNTKREVGVPFAIFEISAL